MNPLDYIKSMLDEAEKKALISDSFPEYNARLKRAGIDTEFVPGTSFYQYNVSMQMVIIAILDKLEKLEAK